MNIDVFDNDHKKIISSINAVVELVREGNIQQELRSTIRKLMMDTASHLRREESHIESHGYSDLQKHCKDHDKILNDLLGIKQICEKDELSQTFKAHLEDQLLNKWFYNHVSTLDVEYAKFLEEKHPQGDDPVGSPATPEDAKLQQEARLQILSLDEEQDYEIISKTEFIKTVAFDEELAVANDVKIQAQENVKKILDDICASCPVEYKTIAESSSNIIESLERNQNAMLALALVQDKDNSTFVHSVNVATYMIVFAKAMGFDKDTMVKVGMGGMLHDVGLSDILSKNGSDKPRVKGQEFSKLMKSHVNNGLEILKKITDLPDEVLIIAGQHHERNDGSGFPEGLVGDDIHLLGKMAIIIDEFDRITSKIENSFPISPKEALKKLLEKGGDAFDQNLVQTFIKAIGIYPVGTTVELKNGSVAVVAENYPGTLLQPVVNVVLDSTGKKNERVKQIDLRVEKGSSDFQIKRVTRVKNRSFDPMDALLALRANT
jgi:hemerythrin-like metal-binding protein/putative nucleotidyltransferase with HDIG domain